MGNCPDVYGRCFCSLYHNKLSFCVEYHSSIIRLFDVLAPRCGVVFQFRPFCRPEPHILLFKRPLGTDPVSGQVVPELEEEAKKAYQQELAGKMDPGGNVASMAM